MTFQKYKVTDNGFSTLLVWISAGATSLQVQASAWDLFPASNFISTLVQYETPWDETSAVVKREKVLVSNNATDTFTITRGFDGDTPVSFNAWDFIYLNVVSKIIEDIQDEVTRLESDKLNIATYNSTTRDDLTAYRLLYIDWTWTETQLALWTAGQVLISQWATSNPIWQAPSVDIAWLTATTNLEWTDDFLVRTSAWNRKISRDNMTENLKEATETTKWVVERATDAEATAWTDTTRYISPKQAKDNYEQKSEVIVSNRANNTASWTVTYNHNLWKIPKLIQVYSTMQLNLSWDNNSFWAYDWVNNRCSYSRVGTLGSLVSNSNSIISYDSTNKWQVWVIHNLTNTTFQVVWTYTATPGATWNIWITFTLIA